jgi:2-iminobutanoate/2-iminopropanoate deaminase
MFPDRKVPSSQVLGVVPLALVMALIAVDVANAQTPNVRDAVYISDVDGAHPESGEYAGDIGSQVRQLFDNLTVRLEGEGLTLRSVASVNVYLSDSRNFPAMNELYRQYFSTEPPARATIEVDLASPEALISMSVVAVSPGNRTVIVPQGLAAPQLPYSWGIQSGNTLYLAGVTSRDPNTYEPVTGDIGTQTQRVLENIGIALNAAGMDYSDVSACRVFLDDARHFGAMNRVYATFFPEAPPARATVRAGVMNPAFKVEIQCIAVQDEARRIVMAEGASPSRSPFSPAIMAGGRLYLSGMLGRGPDGYGDIESQTRLTLENLFATMASAGLNASDVIDARVYATDIRQIGAIQGVYREMMGGAEPPTTIVGAPLMSATAGVEIMFTAEQR